jgi:N-carbamoylputrescine amidase
MRITVCELPHEAAPLHAAWEALCRHTAGHASELLLLPEFAMLEPVWESPCVEAERWIGAKTAFGAWLTRFPQLGVAFVVGTRPVTRNGRPYNEAFLWSRDAGLTSLRGKHFMPNEAGGWEAKWFARGDPAFPVYRADEFAFGVNICTEVWALETYGEYARRGVHAVLTPRATSLATTAKWIAAGIVAAVRAGAFSLSSNRVDPSGACGGAGWIIDPDGEVLARTSAAEPFATMEIDLDLAVDALRTYPRYVFQPLS